MTKVLIITNKNDITSDFIVKSLQERGVSFYRFNTEELSISCFLSIDYQKSTFLLVDRILNQTFDLKQFRSVYYRRPELPNFASGEMTVGEIQFLRSEFYFTLEGIYKILKDAYWISPLYAIREAENKIYQLELAKSLGFTIPNSLITNIFSDSLDFYDENGGDCVIKPVKSGLIEGQDGYDIIFTNALCSRPNNGRQVEFSPNFFQKHIDKKFDVRVTVVGESIFATRIDSQQEQITKVDWRRGEKTLAHSRFELPENLQKLSVQLLKSLNLRFGAIDFIWDINDNFVFLEINPNGQWAWIEKQTGYKISDQIVNLLEYGMD
ncbi:MAG: hypothetical protein VB063_04885 [Bacteroides graminisolvens]|nr:hypothetical protein [Bacteroides graminisolvens]